MQEEKTINIKNGSPIFLWIWVISLVNSILFYMNFDFWIYFWLWITQYIDYYSISQSLDIRSIFSLLSIFISLSFFLIDYLSKKRFNYFLEMWLFIYGLDCLIFFLNFDIFYIISHLVMLKIIYDSKK